MQRKLIIDFESFPNRSLHWQGKHEQEIIEIEEEGYILCMGYKFIGDKKAKIIGLPDVGWNKKKLAEKIHDIISQADVVIAHNGNNFDFKWANRTFIVHGLKPPKPYKTFDTLSIARSKFNFNSNSLKDLAQLLGLRPKMETGGFALWKGYEAKNKKCIKKMHQYCLNDVELLEEVYFLLAPWATNYPTTEVGMFCPKCGSNKIQFRGSYINKTKVGKRFQCTSCGSWGISNLTYKLQLNEFVK